MFLLRTFILSLAKSRRILLFDANLTHLPQSKKFFAKCHYCEEGIPLYDVGFRGGELYYAIMLSPDETNTWEARQKRKVGFRINNNVYVFTSEDVFEDALFVYEGNVDGTGFIDEKSKKVAMEIMEEQGLNYDLNRMKEAVESETVEIPHGLKGKALREFILEKGEK